MRRAILVTTVLAATVMLPAAPAGAEIVVQKSIAGVAVGDTTSDVKKELGKPDKVKTGMDAFGAFTRYSYDDPLVSVVFKTSATGKLKVTSVTSKDPAERTKSDVGVGSTKGEVKDGVDGVKCETFEGISSCTLGKFEPGRIVTSFFFSSKGRVQRVQLGRVID